MAKFSAIAWVAILLVTGCAVEMGETWPDEAQLWSALRTLLVAVVTALIILGLKL